MKKRPITTLFMLSSVDGKISTGDSQYSDFDADIPKLSNTPAAAGLQQYYDLEKETDLFFLNSGKTFAKLGVNVKEYFGERINCTCVVIDNNWLRRSGLEFLCRKYRNVILFTKNYESRYAFKSIINLDVELMTSSNLTSEVLIPLYNKYNCENLTLQTGGRLNGALLQEHAIDRVRVIVAPLLVGGSETPTIVDGQGIPTPTDLHQLGLLKLNSCRVLDSSYIVLDYDVLNSTEHVVNKKVI